MQSIDELTSVKAMAIERLNWSRGFTESLLANVSDDQLTARPGGKGNHTLWIIGHLAQADDDILAAMTGKPRQLPAEHHELFGGGSEPSDDPADYPPRDELMQRMRRTRKRLVDWVESLNEESAHQPTPEPLQPFAPDAITLPFTIVAHDLFHVGQVAAIRASLGLPRVHR